MGGRDSSKESAFEKIIAAARLSEAWFERDAECGGDLITIPEGGLTASPPDPDLIPKVRNGPDKWEPPEIEQGDPPF